MSPRELAALDRVNAAAREMVVARAMLEVEAGECAAAINAFGDAYRSAIDTEAASMLADHPDVVEADVRLTNWYDTPG